MLQLIMNECVECRWGNKGGKGRGDENVRAFFSSSFSFFIRSIL